MPNTAPIPEETAEQTARRVLKRWNKIAFWTMAAIGICYLLGILWLWIRIDEWRKPSTYLIFVLGLSVSMLGILVGFLWRMRLFFRGVSAEEKAALQAAIEKGRIRTTPLAQQILGTSEKVVPAREYVRASSTPEQPDTLLRAAQPSADNAPEQLLRPTQE